MLKRRFQSFPLDEKNTNQKFNKRVKEGIESYKKTKNVMYFFGLCHHYMMAYQKHANSNNKALILNEE